MATGDSAHDRPEATESQHSGEDAKSHERRMYVRFGLMIATSTVVMFVLTSPASSPTTMCGGARNGSTWRS